MPYHILLVDDDHFFHTLSAYSLRGKKDKLLLTTCYNLTEARQRLTEQTFDAILLDFLLPDGEGPELIPEIQSETAILLLSGLSENLLSTIKHPRIQRVLNKHEMSPHSLQDELLGAIRRQKLSTYRQTS